MSVVAVAINKEAKYPRKEYNFRPDKAYPEYFFGNDISPEQNKVYELVRDSLRMMSLDSCNYGSPSWNPLGDGYIRPGDYVLIKPNMVIEKNHGDGGTECLYTQPSVVAAIIDYVCIALSNTGRIVVADAPLQTCDFGKLIHESGYFDLIKYYQNKGIDIELHDLRELTSVKKGNVIRASIREDLENAGSIVKLNELSFHSLLSNDQIKSERITSYNPDELAKHHSCHKHEYLIAKDLLDANCVINVSKPKTHRKAGATISLKNFVGINSRKEYLPHHRIGGTELGGDEYLGRSVLRSFGGHLLDLINRSSSRKHYVIANILQFFHKSVCSIDSKLFSDKSSYYEGSWYGNDTIWRTILDLNLIVKYADINGIMTKREQRKVFCLGDMVVMGEKEGPLLPSPRNVGIISAGGNCVCFDEAISTLMGLDSTMIPSIHNARTLKGDYCLVGKDDEATIVSNNKKWNGCTIRDLCLEDTIRLVPSEGWKNHIELKL